MKNFCFLSLFWLLSSPKSLAQETGNSTLVIDNNDEDGRNATFAIEEPGGNVPSIDEKDPVNDRNSSVTDEILDNGEDEILPEEDTLPAEETGDTPPEPEEGEGGDEDDMDTEEENEENVLEVNATRVSYVLEPFELIDPRWNIEAEGFLEIVNSTFAFGEHSLRATLGNGVEFGWILEDNEGLYNCFNADTMSLWYATNSTSDLQMIVNIFDDTNCSPNCTGSQLNEHIAWEMNVSNSNDEWEELTLDLTNVTFPLQRIRGWKIRVEHQDEPDSDLDPSMVYFDQLACHGPGSLFGAPFFVSDNLELEIGTWTQMYFGSEMSANETNRTLSDGILDIDYTVVQAETWGGFIDYSHVAAANSYYNLSLANHIEIHYTTRQGASIAGRTLFRWVLQDASDCVASCDLHNHLHERYYSFSDILDEPTEHGTVLLPLVASDTPYTPFWLTGWSGIIGNAQLDLDAIKGYTLEIVLDSFLDQGTPVSGEVSFYNVSAVVAPIEEADTSMCIVEPGAFIPEDYNGWWRLEFVGGICCTVCDQDAECVYALTNGRDCYIASAVEPSVLALASNEVQLSDVTVFWMDDPIKRGSWCEKCECRLADATIDCRGSNLTVIPKVWNSEISWKPRVLDLRENPMLSLLGTGALESIQDTIEELWLPSGLKHAGFATFMALPGLKSVNFEKEMERGEVILNNAITSPSDSFSDVCCSLGEHVDLESPSNGLTFCHMQVDEPGIDSVYYDFEYYTYPTILSVIFPDSSFMAEAAESVNKCAEYCAVSSDCNYFSYDARLPNAEHYCHLLQSTGPDIEQVCCEPDHYADENQTIPGWISGMPPRTRHTDLNARVIISEEEFSVSEENAFQGSYSVSLGSLPIRGAVWIVPEVRTDRGYNYTLSPSRVVLYDNETVSEITLSLYDVTSDSTGGTMVIRNNIYSCDEAFKEFAGGSQENSVFVDVVTPLAENRVGLGIVIAIVGFLFVLFVIIGYLIYERRFKVDDSVWKVQLKDLHFDDPPEVVGRGTFGLVLLAEYRGTRVAVKRVIPPQAKKDRSQRNSSMSDSVRVSSTRMVKFDHVDKSLSLRDESTSPSNVDDSASGYNSGSSDTGVDEALSSGSDSAVPESYAMGKTSWGGINLESGSGVNIKTSQNDLGKGLGSITDRTGLRSRNNGEPRSSIAKRYSQMKKEFIEEMRYLAKLRHPNITTVMGAVIEKGVEPMLIMEYMDHGSLYDILHNETMIIGSEITLPILSDVLAGLRFLHSAEPPVVHGDLKAGNILVDSKFRAKVADFGLSQKKQLGGTGTPFWMAPELLRRESPNTAMTDIYSFGIIIYEVYSRKDPYEGMAFKDVLKRVADKSIGLRPPFPNACPPQVQSIMADCIVDDAQLRPSASELSTRMQRIVVEDNDNREKTSVSLFDIFPRHIAEALRDGRKVEAEHKDCVTIFFSDIVGFTDMSSLMTPQKVALMLDRLYHAFDELSEKHDVFKVETIGDAYMAVTNLVKNQEDTHVKRIAEFAIDAIQAANFTQIDEDDPSKGYVNIRVGFHSGPVVADVVGNRNPRYCLFGDSVNTASRMESNSKANRINCSSKSAELLKVQAPSLRLRDRGKVAIKGKGQMHLFWVNEGGRPSVNPTGDDLLNWVAGNKGKTMAQILEVDEGKSEDFHPTPEQEDSFAAQQRAEQHAEEALDGSTLSENHKDYVLEEAHPDTHQPEEISPLSTEPIREIEYGDADFPGVDFNQVETKLRDRLMRNGSKCGGNVEE